GTAVACPTPSCKPTAPTNPAPEPSTLGPLTDGRVRWRRSLPLGALRPASRSTVPRFTGTGGPPGQALAGGHQYGRGRMEQAGSPEAGVTASGSARAGR